MNQLTHRNLTLLCTLHMSITSQYPGCQIVQLFLSVSLRNPLITHSILHSSASRVSHYFFYPSPSLYAPASPLSRSFELLWKALSLYKHSIFPLYILKECLVLSTSQIAPFILAKRPTFELWLYQSTLGLFQEFARIAWLSDITHHDRGRHIRRVNLPQRKFCIACNLLSLLHYMWHQWSYPSHRKELTPRTASLIHIGHIIIMTSWCDNLTSSTNYRS